MFKGSLGLDKTEVLHADRHGLLWLGRGRLFVEDGCLVFVTVGIEELDEGAYQIPCQALSCLMMGPGSMISHDALRILSRYGVGVIAVGEDGVRFYASMPAGPDHSGVARRQARLWADGPGRLEVAHRMYERRFGERFAAMDMATLRGLEGSRVRRSYELIAKRHGLTWAGRRYDRAKPEEADPLNQALNHVATAVQACAQVAVACKGAIPQLGFIHEDSGLSFCLDIADLYRTELVMPVACEAVVLHNKRAHEPLERVARRLIGKRMKELRLIDKMIDAIEEVLNVPGYGGDSEPTEPI
jgi:CRISP-associated protein Cas1